MLKHKILSLIVVMVMILSAIPANIYAQNSEVANSDDLNFAIACGIFPDGVDKTSVITRIELAEIYTNIILGSDTETEGAESDNFTDVDYDMSYYADFVASIGLMGGVGNGLFAPYDNVTYQQLIKTIVSFLGYDVKAQSLGGYPTGYMAVAAQLGLSLSNKASADSFVTFEGVATLFKIAASCPLYDVTGYGDVSKYQEITQINYLAKYLDINFISNVVNANYIANIYSDDELKYNEIIVGTEKYLFDPDVYPLNDLLGHKVDIYYKEINNVNHIIYMEDNRFNRVLEIDGKDVDVKGDTLIYYDGFKEKEIRFSDDVNILYNGGICENYNNATFNAWNNTYRDGGIKAIDNNYDRKYDYIMIDAYDTYVVSSIKDDIVHTSYRDGYIIKINDYEDGKNVLFRNLDGKPIKMSDVEDGSVISVSKDLNGRITNIFVTNDIFVSEVSSIEIQDGKYYFGFGDRVFEPSESLALNPQLERVEIGQRMKLMFNKDGLVSDIEALGYHSNSVAMVVDSKVGTGLEAGESAYLKLFTSEGSFIECPLTSKVNVTYGGVQSVEKASDVLAFLGTNDDGEVVRQPIYYRLNENKELNWISICNPESGSIDGLHEIGVTSGEYRGGSTMSIAGKVLTKGAIYFCVPSEDDRDREEMYEIKTLPGGYSVTVTAYGDTKDTKLATILVKYDNNPGSSMNNDTNIFVIDSITKAIDSYGDEKLKVRGLKDKRECEYYADESVMKIAPNGTLPEKGDIVRLSLGKGDTISACVMTYDRSEKQLHDTTGYAISENPSTSSYANPYRVLLGKIIYANDVFMTLRIYNSNGTYTDESYLKSDFTYYKYEKVSDSKATVSVASASDFYMLPDGETDNRDVFIHLRSGDPRSIVLYK